MLKNNITPWIVYLAIVGVAVVVANHLNSRWDNIKKEPQSLVEQGSAPLKAIFVSIKPDQTARVITFTAELVPDFILAIPATWSAQSKECIRVYTSRDNMPVLVAKNFSPHMQDDAGLPYVTTDNAELEISGYPAHIGTLADKSRNALIVVDAKDTYVLRSCPGASDYLFYQILKSFQIISGT